MASFTRPATSTESDVKRYEREMSERDHDNGPFNGSTKLITALLTLLTSLALAGVLGGIALFGRVSALDERSMQLEQKVDLIITGRIRVPHE